MTSLSLCFLDKICDFLCEQKASFYQDLNLDQEAFQELIDWAETIDKEMENIWMKRPLANKFYKYHQEMMPLLQALEPEFTYRGFTFKIKIIK